MNPLPQKNNLSENKMAEDKKLLDDIKSSIMDMQSQMQSTYNALSDIKVTGKSNDETVTITMFANYSFGDIDFDEKALQGGVKEFKWRIREAWKNATEAVQQATQEKTVELLQGMQIPDDIKNISVEEKEDD
tara:strand:- start:132 stop:527 length:396 start_codon:yes stop_codon:yes gene_type:complete